VTSAEIFSPDESADDASARAGKSDAAFRTISEVAEDLEVPQHVLRFWETKFTQVKPLKRGGGRRYYRPEDVVLLKRIRSLLYTDGMTIRGVQKMLREGGSKGLSGDAHAPVIAAPALETPPSTVPGPEREDLSRLLGELTVLRDELRAAAR
jgi:DNA-binding transcriptional MerR regulator